MADRGERKDRLLRLRRQIAGALATIDRPESTPVLEAILDAPEDSVRSSAAYALARMSDASAATGLAKAIGLDYGTIGKASRNPAVHAHLVRRAVAAHGGSAGTKSVIATAKGSPFTSVQFLALCAE
jgi:HEAT repeat protein